MMYKKILTFGLVVTFLVGLCVTATAGVSPEEAARLKKNLTPFGAERAGNADGSIPAWEGGIPEIPAGIDYKDGDFPVDPFADDKKLFSITAANMEQYADKLSEGQKALLKKYPETYRIDVYPAHRTFAAPTWVYDNTFKNATSASTTADMLGFEGAYGGIPFPIPKNGTEAMQNHLNRWNMSAAYVTVAAGVVLPNGTFSLAGGGYTMVKNPYYIKGSNAQDQNNGQYFIYQAMETPARRKGELLVVKDYLNPVETPRKAWQYLPGQRRVRRAPTIAYDTPNPSSAGTTTYDDAYQFLGGLDRYDWKLVGKKEMYIPYNCYQTDLATLAEYLTGYHTNPDVVRWELHRVWEVEATLKEGKRHIYAKRTFYLDEDSWISILTDKYDGKGNLWRTGVQMTSQIYTIPAYRETNRFDYDFQSDVYAANALVNGQDEYLIFVDDLPNKFFTPEYLRRQGRR